MGDRRGHGRGRALDSKFSIPGVMALQPIQHFVHIHRLDAVLDPAPLYAVLQRIQQVTP
jgi:hypothetical protein